MITLVLTKSIHIINTRAQMLGSRDESLRL